MVIFKNSKNKKIAQKFLKYLVSPEIQARWANELGQIPVNKKAIGKIDFEKNKYMKILIKAIERAKKRPPVAEYPEVERIFTQEVGLFLKGKKDIDETLKNLQKRIEKLIRE